MSVLKIFYDDALESAIRDNRLQIVAGLEKMMRERLRADPAKCQIIMSAAMHISPLPVYVDMQFRANEFRCCDVVAEAMKDIATILQGCLATSIRIRSFDIDESTLHALDVDGQSQP